MSQKLAFKDCNLQGNYDLGSDSGILNSKSRRKQLSFDCVYGRVYKVTTPYFSVIKMTFLFTPLSGPSTVGEKTGWETQC